MKRFLIAHFNYEMREMLHEALYEAFEEDFERPYIDSRHNKVEALLSCSNQDFDFIIASLSLAADRKQPIEPKQGLELLRLLRRRGHEMPVLLVAPTRQPEIEHEIATSGGFFVYEDRIKGSLEEEVIQQAEYSFESPTETARNRLDIEINLADASFSIEDQRSRMPPLTGRLRLHGERLLTLTGELINKVQGPEPDWEIHLHNLGAELKRDLFAHQANREFQDAYLRARTKAQCSGDAARIRFVVSEREQYVFPLEAILMPDRPEYWMLQAPLFRTLKEGDFPRASPLFEDPKDSRRPINCLLINADTSGTVDKPRCELAPMRRTKDECMRLCRELERRREELHIGKIKLLSADEPDENNTPFWGNLRRRLQAEEWHLVHYAGHSYYDEQQGDEQEGKGYIFLPEKYSSTPQPIIAREFASAFLETPRFVYLSSCESSADDFVFELARSGIPAVAGFRWGVEENAAFDYAKSFYRHLFEEQCLEVAFWKARKEIHDDRDREQNHIWAAAMLIIQTKR